MQHKVFVIIVTYNGQIWYKNCFQSLRNSIYPVTTIVIDNASTDNTIEYISDNFPEIVLIPQEKNLGFGQGNNLGISYALEHGAEYLFLLNQDTWIEPDTIDELLKISINNPEYSIISPINLNAEKNTILDGFLNYLVDYHNTDKNLFNDLYFNRLKDVYEIKNTIAATWFMQRNVIENIGGFDPVFFHFGEDDNYIQRVQYHGYKVGICPKVGVVHDVTKRLEEDTIYRSKKVSEKRALLLNWYDINQKLNISHKVLILIVQILKKSILLKSSRVKYFYMELGLLISKRKQIVASRNKNKTKGLNWIKK